MSELNNTAGVLTQPIEAIGCPHCDTELDISGNELFDVFACPQCENKISTPGRFGDFILTRKLGQGGMGAVFLGIDEKLGREVALKVNRKEFGDNPKFLERFSIEAQAMARFNHSNVVQIYSYGQEYGQPYMCTEYVTGGDLASQMVPGEALDQVAMLHVAKDLAEGLQAAKDNGLIHGDIKPENVMFDERGNAKIMDFGLAKFGGGEEGKPKEVWGTPYYIAPEKAKKQGEDHLSDQYSLGAALYHTLAGHPPFDGDTPRDVVVARLQDDAPPLWEVNPYVSKKTSAIIERMMSRSPSSRYPTYASMQADFANAINDAEATPGPYVYEEAAAPKKKFPVLPVILGGGGLLTLLLGGLLFAFMAKDKPAPAPAPDGGQRTVAGTTNTSGNKTLIVSSDRNDNQPFTSSQLKKLESARLNFMDGKDFQGESDLFAAMDKAEDDRIGRQWINLFQAMVYKQKGETRGYNDQLDKVLGAKIKYTGSTPPKNSPVHFARYLKGQMPEAEWQSKRKSFPTSFQHLADYATALRAADSTPGKFAGTVKPYIAGKAGPNDNWPYIMQGHAKSLAAQAGTVQSKIDQAAKDKSKARGLLEGQRKAPGFSKIWHTVLDKELNKYSKPAPKKPAPKPPKKPEPEKPTPKTPDKPAVVDTPEPAPDTPAAPAVDPKQAFADWEKPAIAAAKNRDFGKVVDALGAFETDDPAWDERADIIRGIYENMPAMQAAVVEKAPSLSFARKVGSKTGKLINGDAEGILLGVGGGVEVPVKWSELTGNEYFQLAKQAISKSAATNKVKAKHLFSLAYLAKLERNQAYGRTFAAGVRQLDPELAKMFGKL